MLRSISDRDGSDVLMRASESSSAEGSRRVAAILALVVSLLAAVGLMVSGPATAASPAPTAVRIDSVTSDVAAPGGTPGGAVPTVLVKTGGTVHVNVSFYDSTGAPASFTKDTAVTVTSAGKGGVLTQITKTVKKGATFDTINVSFAEAANQIRLTVKIPVKGGVSLVAPASDAQLFDVLTQLTFTPSFPGTFLQQGIGGDSGCQNATPTNPVCGVVILPHGAQSDQVLLSLGACDADYALCGSNKGVVVQTLAKLTGLYAKSDPAALLIKCDKTLCGVGPIQGQNLNFSLAGNEALAPATPCPAKGTVGADQKACVDYVQSKRDGSGDTLLYLLFTQDMRGSVS
jgi:hypothetical protein